ncbi:DnaB-like helicase N-terminal domain-containing protein [Rhodococcus sp. IEGM 1408]|uniref:DnaB-like helicase N-terminal domain-containing protein n=1 Tax=Rhodococcus sp. IEGM 1408 TaxID=3082220 RepID=UPI002955D8AA|nr:DnaB-like helicase N-terminal domain-containing protein [Rhodococcus sp. IEGM 1408]MDV8002870.1 DnaB-like helicase N-terminal domain-containing protein [Rhodococcus sp. IEGM 1408]
MTAEQQATADPVDVDDLAATDAAPTVPELDPEAALLCALLHTSDTAETRHITGHLEAADFLSPRYGDLFQVIADLIAASQPHHAPRVLAALTSAGRMAGHHGQLLADALQVVTLLGTPAVGLRTLAADVLDAAYRRRFARTAAELTRASAEAPTDALFEILLDHGRAMRRETNRRESLTAGQAPTQA